MVSLLLTCIFLVTGNSLVRAIYYTVPPSATVGQEFTATWFSPPTSLVQFWLAFPVNDFDVQQNDIVYTVTPNDRGSGTVVLPVPTTTGSFYIGTYSPDLNNVGNSPPILAVVAEGDTSPRSNSPKLSSPTLEPAPSQDESSAGTHVGTSSENSDTITTSQLNSAPATSSTGTTFQGTTTTQDNHTSVTSLSNSTLPTVSHSNTQPTGGTSNPSETSASITKPPTNIGKIVGIVSGTVVSLILIAACLFCRFRHATRRRSRGGARQTVDPYLLWEHLSSSFSANSSEAAESVHDSDADRSERFTTTDIASNRNTQIHVSRQYRSGPFFKKANKGRAMGRNERAVSESANNLQNEARDRDSPPRTTRSILRHLDSGIRIFENRARESVNDKEPGLESGNGSDGVIELPPEYSAN